MTTFSEEDHKDIQGLVLFGYNHAPVAKYILLEFTDDSATKAWLGSIAETINRKSKKLDKTRKVHNLAFTHQGFQKLGLTEDTLDKFDQEFIEGIDTPHRNRVLGDTGNSSPENWYWGGQQNDTIHAVLCLFALNEEDLEKSHQDHLIKMKEANIKVLNTMDTLTLEDGKEHFGFRDGISQPILEGTLKHKDNSSPTNVVKIGEFILGYENEYKEINFSPTMQESQDPSNILPYQENLKDFGRNGSYMVFRQLKQDVQSFWKYMNEQSNDDEEMVKLASKMVGRWPSGAPLAKYPNKDPYAGKPANADTSDDNNFGYRDSDFDGMKCPIGSHLRRSNPRDALSNTDDADESNLLVNRHRILRRGRMYGQSPSKTMDPKELMTKPSTEETGIQFICFNGNLAKQFEFVQHSWLNRSTFAGLYDSPDPITDVKTKEFTLQSCPVSKRYKDIPKFVQTVGGAYFFLPGVRAIKYLASL